MTRPRADGTFARWASDHPVAYNRVGFDTRYLSIAHAIGRIVTITAGDIDDVERRLLAGERVRSSFATYQIVKR